jgi:hypothetical protein
VQHRAPLPPGVSATRAIAFLQGGLYMLSGLLAVYGGVSFATASGLTGSAAGATVVAIGVVVTVISALLIWGAWALGSLSPAARVGVLIFECLAVILGLVGLEHPGLGIVNMVLAGVAVYYLQFDPQTRAAFAARPRDTPPADSATPLGS